MANNTYGIVKPSLLNIENDVDIFYNYRSNRNTTEEVLYTKVTDPTTMLSISSYKDNQNNNLPLVGMYDLKLPLSDFGKKGIYTIYIKPKEYECTIQDIGSLVAYPNIKGIVIDIKTNSNSALNELFKNDNLVGYRIEYLNNENVRQDYYRIITSGNLCEIMSQNVTSANTTSNGYRFNNNGSLCFLTVTPSTSPSFKSNAKPYIGVPGQNIIISSTKFDPVMIEVEMVEHDIETLSIMAEGTQIRNLEEGTVTTYNFEGEVYKQQEFFTLKKDYNKNNVYEIKRTKNDISNTLDLENITIIKPGE